MTDTAEKKSQIRFAYIYSYFFPLGCFLVVILRTDTEDELFRWKMFIFENVQYGTVTEDWLEHITLDCVYSLGRRSFGHLARWTTRLARCQPMLSNGKSSILVTARRMRSNISIWWRDSSATRQIAAPLQNTSFRDSGATGMRSRSRGIRKHNWNVWDWSCSQFVGNSGLFLVFQLNTLPTIACAFFET